MGIVGPDGKEIAGVKTEAPAGGARCLFCAVRERAAQTIAGPGGDVSTLPPTDANSLVGALVTEGLYAGLKVLAQVLEGSGLETDKAAAVVGAAASPCPDCTKACAAAEVSGRAREAVAIAVGNIRASSVFVVGRGPGGARVV